MAIWPYFIVFIGSGLGGALRHGVNSAVSDWLGMRFPWGILLINITGSLLLGLLAGFFAFRGEASQTWRLLLTTGICGGYTTFSTFSLDTAMLWQKEGSAMAVAYVAASVLLSVLAVFAGLWLMRN